jgi:hypothetical protein
VATGACQRLTAAAKSTRIAMIMTIAAGHADAASACLDDSVMIIGVRQTGLVSPAR